MSEEQQVRNEALSAADGPPPPPGTPPTVAALLEEMRAARPKAEALIGRHRRYTYAALDRATDAAAVVLEALGVGPGVRVAASSANCPEIVIAFLASMRLGAVWVGIFPQLAGPEKAFQLQDCGVHCLLADERTASQIAELRGDLPELAHVVDMDPSRPDNQWNVMLDQQMGRRPARCSIDPLALAAIVYTSGTSGFPKGVMHSQHNMMVVAAATLGGARGDQGPPALKRGATIPLTTLNVMVITAVVVLAGGGALVCVDRRDARGIIEWVKAERIGHIHLSGAHLHDLLNDGTTQDELASLLFVNNAGAGIPVALRQRFERALGPQALTSYGLTEALAGVSGFPRGAPYVEGSSGAPNGHLEVEIRDADGLAAPVGESGEICVRAIRAGPWANLYRPMLGYWNQPAATAGALAGGWLHTGDIGHLDASGHLFIQGRMSEVILRGGANIYPAEIERVLQAEPAVREVSVIGCPDERLGEQVVAAVELKPGQEADVAIEALKSRCARELARYKWPSRWHIVEALPRNAMNKVAKPALRAMLADAAD